MRKIGKTKTRIFTILFAVCVLLVTLTACGGRASEEETEPRSRPILRETHEPEPEPEPALESEPTLVGQWERSSEPFVLLQEPPPPTPSPPEPRSGEEVAEPEPSPVQPRAIVVPYPIDDYAKREHPNILEYEQVAIFERRVTYEFFSDGNGVWSVSPILFEGDEEQFWFVIWSDRVSVLGHVAAFWAPQYLVTWSADGNRLLTQYDPQYGPIPDWPQRSPATRTFNISGNTLTLGEGEHAQTYTRVR